MKTAVVIPYYQEEPGILREAVRSVIAQEGVTDLEIIVVDDGSPAPARDDLERLDLPAHVTLKLIEQPNRGPGAARNRGLDNVSPEITWVAFLDSDDKWLHGHLQNAQGALEQGGDMYFANAWLEKKSKDIFTICELDLNQHRRTASEDILYQMLDCVYVFVSRNFAHASTVVYNYRKLRRLRFPETFRIGEDRAFWFTLAPYCEKILFSCVVECLIRHCGVNIYQSIDWDSPKIIWLISEQSKCLKWMSNKAQAYPRVQEFVSESISDNRDRFILSLIHSARKPSISSILCAIEFLQSNPAVLRHLFPVAWQSISRKMRRRQSHI